MEVTGRGVGVGVVVEQIGFGKPAVSVRPIAAFRRLKRIFAHVEGIVSSLRQFAPLESRRSRIPFDQRTHRLCVQLVGAAQTAERAVAEQLVM